MSSPDFLWHYLGGLFLGIGLLIFLEIYPGRAHDFEKKFEQNECPAKPKTSDHDPSRTKPTDIAYDLANVSSNLGPHEPQAAMSSKTAWAGDRIPSEALERVRKRFRLTKEQMELVMETSRNDQLLHQKNEASWMQNLVDGGNHTSPHQVMNRIVYTVLIGILVYLFNRDYGDIISVWFVQHFPREASTLGFN